MRVLTTTKQPKSQALVLVLVLAFALGACGGDEPPSAPNPQPPPGPNPTPTPPQTGFIQVSTATTGGDLDPDGYTTAMDGNSGRSIGLNGPTRSSSWGWPPTAR